MRGFRFGRPAPAAEISERLREPGAFKFVEPARWQADRRISKARAAVLR
jgi:hypothetical protein